MMKSDFQSFLQSKSQSYNNINRFRAFFLYEKYKKHLSLKPIIHIIGTNGKGSTGRFLAQLLGNLGYTIGHFTSPHIFKFNERFYLNGKDVSDELLEETHNELAFIMQEDLQRLSYFEYSTFLAALLFKDCDFIILEAGLGGEYDSTNIFKKQLSIFTTIAYDHTQILGTKLEDIARTKLKAMGALALITNEQDENTLKLAQKISILKNTHLHILSSDFKVQLQAYTQKFALPRFLEHNLSLALKALVLLLNSKDEALKALGKLTKLDLRGRCEKISENVYVDVGHNALAASSLLENFKGQKLVLVYNSFLDKDIFEILRILKPIIDTIKIYDYPSEDRALIGNKLVKIAKELGIQAQPFDGLCKDKKYLVFGSFVLAQNFLRDHFA